MEHDVLRFFDLELRAFDVVREVGIEECGVAQRLRGRHGCRGQGMRRERAERRQHLVKARKPIGVVRKAGRPSQGDVGGEPGRARSQESADEIAQQLEFPRGVEGWCQRPGLITQAIERVWSTATQIAVEFLLDAGARQSAGDAAAGARWLEALEQGTGPRGQVDIQQRAVTSERPRPCNEPNRHARQLDPSLVRCAHEHGPILSGAVLDGRPMRDDGAWGEQ